MDNLFEKVSSKHWEPTIFRDNEKCRHFLKFIIDQKNRDPVSDHVGMWVCHNYARDISQFQTYRQVDFARSPCPTVLQENPLISEDSENACNNIQKAVGKGREFVTWTYETGPQVF